MLKTGFKELDKNTGGIRDDDLYLITGKDHSLCSVFLINAACLLSEQHRVLYLLQGLPVDEAHGMLKMRYSRGGRLPVLPGSFDNIVLQAEIPDRAGIAALIKQYAPDLLIMDRLDTCSLEDIAWLKQLAVELDIPIVAQIPWRETADDLLLGREDVSIRIAIEDEDSMVSMETIINPGGTVYPEGKYFRFYLKYLPECCVMANVDPDDSHGNKSWPEKSSEENDGGAVHIYFDMDGVLADFNRGVRELCHMEPIVQGSGPKNDDKLWAAVREVSHFYDKLEPVEGSVELFNIVHDKYGDNCQILTGIPKPRRGIVTAAEDKIRWAHRILSSDVKVNIVYREQKPEFCHGNQDVLIDDYNKNIREWQGYGGTGILSTSADNTLKELKRRGII